MNLRLPESFPGFVLCCTPKLRQRKTNSASLSHVRALAREQFALEGLTSMKLGIPVYEGVNLLDVAGPYEMFSWVDKSLGLESIIVSADGHPVTTLNNSVRFDAHASFAATPSLDVLWVPGGAPAALGKIMSDPASPYLAYLKKCRRRRNVCAPCVKGRYCWHARGCLTVIRPQAPLGICGMPKAFSQNRDRYHTSAQHPFGESPDGRRDFVGTGRGSNAHPTLIRHKGCFRRATHDAVFPKTAGFRQHPG